ncbi:hypothetical protein PR202_ga29992 [Eleusine coracana subsp. coracana]|uniref:DUF4220 domain-containing protein n=1 Tax=Eleusine coracana subsp. coracana TaxID=191504 RepID=A0AAV5DLE2_ELECO|nr:hypothetical protein PR202_ga29992 [Eleusine coracana subsp. coracana]
MATWATCGTQLTSSSCSQVVSLTVRPLLDDEQALLLAQNLFHFCRRAIVDDCSFQEDEEDGSPSISQMIFSLEWTSMCKVVEMELSLMYDILYTKAAVIHTWRGYLIRLLSPLATAAAISLFWIFPNQHCRRLGTGTADMVVTYILLAVSFLLDVVWLVRALGSTWAYAFLGARPRIGLHHTLLYMPWVVALVP